MSVFSRSFCRTLILVAIFACCVGPAAAQKKEFQLGDMIKPFTPPTLAELDKTAKKEAKKVRKS